MNRQTAVCAPCHSIGAAAVWCAQRDAVVAIGEEDATVAISCGYAAVDLRIVVAGEDGICTRFQP